MRYKITTQILEGETSRCGTDIYEQIVEDLDVATVVMVANKLTE